MAVKEQLRSLRLALLAALAILSCFPGVAAAAFDEEGAPVDLVIALDTSGTMRELIDTARVKIWEIVNDLAEADPTPRLRLGLVTYGNQTGTQADGWVRVQADLTDDLDYISGRLFALRSRGANEYVGRALQTSIESLSWSTAEESLKLLFLVGNEPPDQDPYVRFQEMSELARQREILVSAVFCGSAESEDAAGWKEMALLAEGQFASIDHNLPAVMIATPVDRQLVELGELMNETYVPYGHDGKANKKSRSKEDKNARKYGAAVTATRAITKASPIYSSAGDLVAAHDQGTVNVLTLADSDLPRSMRTMTPDERLIFIEEISDLRQELRERIMEAGRERRRIVAQRSSARYNDRAFDLVMRRTIKDKARAAGFYFPEE